MQRIETPRGELVLRRAGDDYEVISNGVFLMDTRDGRSERLLVRTPVEAGARRLLLGGLGVGFSLAEALSSPAVERVTVVEVEPAVVAWHTPGSGPLAAYSRNALADPRVRVVVGDLVSWLGESDERYDALCLDIDNGPDWTVTEANAGLYSPDGIRLLQSRLNAGGMLTVWSANASPAFERRLRAAFTTVDVHTVEVARGEPDVVYVARSPERRSRGQRRRPIPTA